MDACNVRQALEWSWGTEFLEMEQASQMRDVRAIYEPRIDITYSSDTRLFTIEDNGIGINEYDLEHFIAQIGASYYTSTDFFNQQLKYEPYSHYGIGLCSCFIVSKAVLIESKKDKVINTAWNISNPQDTAPVMAKWFGESGPPFEILSEKAVKHYEKMKDKGENVYIDTLTYEQFMMLGDAELNRRFSMQDEAEQKAKIDREQANELEYADESQKAEDSDSTSGGEKPVRNPEREKPKWEDTITNRMMHWSYTAEQKEEVKKALAAGVPKATILTYFYPEVTVEKMSSYWKNQ